MEGDRINDTRYLLRKPLLMIRHDKGDTLLSLLVHFLLKPWVPRTSLSARLLLSIL